MTAVLDRARAAAEAVSDPELPMLTLAELGVLRDVQVTEEGTVIVTMTPTYSGCPAVDEMRADVARAVRAAGYDSVEIRTVLQPAWTTDWITAEGKRKLAQAGIAPPGPAPRAGAPILVNLGPTLRRTECPQCGSYETTEISRFGATACRALYRCNACREPFEHFKEL